MRLAAERTREEDKSHPSLLYCPHLADIITRLVRPPAFFGGVFYRVTNVPDSDAANRCMDLVREYRA